MLSLVGALEAWMREERRKLSRHSDIAGDIDYMLKRWTSFSRRSDRGGERAALLYGLIVTALCRARHKQVYAAR